MESLVLPERENFEFSNESVTEEGKVCVSPIQPMSYTIDFNIFLQKANADDQSKNTIRHNVSKISQRMKRKKSDGKKTGGEEDPTEIRNDQNESTQDTMETCVEAKKDTGAGDISTRNLCLLGGSFIQMKGKKSVVNDIENEKTYFVKGKTKSSMENRLKMSTDPELKTKKWKIVSTTDFSFLNTSLFPRKIKTDADNDFLKEKYEEIESELNSFELMIKPYENLQDIEGYAAKEKSYLRKDRDRKKRKARIQVKDKHCKSVKNNNGRITLFVHHRVYKLMEMELQRISYLPSQTLAKLDKKREEIQALRKSKATSPVSQSKYNTPRYVAPVAPPQCLAYTLNKGNANRAAEEFDMNVVNLLINLQHRELTPEDYDLLLRLDEKVAPKTVEEDLLKTFKTDIVTESHVCDVCPICMETYEVGQERKYLPCNHIFHSKCIDMWLKNSSLNCPIDNLPVENS